MSKWKPIETAPEIENILIYKPPCGPYINSVKFGWFSPNKRDFFIFNEEGTSSSPIKNEYLSEYTHWAELPELKPPTMKSSKSLLDLASYEKKGGHNIDPTCPKPNIKPAGQRPTLNMCKNCDNGCSGNCLKQDSVNNPAHYTSGEIECIDAIKAALTHDEFAGFCKGNIIKYTWREQRKGGIESLKKAKWYLEKLIGIKND